MEKFADNFAKNQAKEMREKLPFPTPSPLSTPMDIADTPTADEASNKAAALLQRAKGLSQKASLVNAEKTAAQVRTHDLVWLHGGTQSWHALVDMEANPDMQGNDSCLM
jgi:hypothetical protein